MYSVYSVQKTDNFLNVLTPLILTKPHEVDINNLSSLY